MKQNSQLGLFKIEAVTGVAETLDGSLAQRIQNLTVSVKHTKEDRKNINGMLGSQGAITVGTECDIGFDFELSASGTAGSAPSYDPIMLIAGHKKVTTASDVTYSPVDSGSPTATFGYWVDGLYMIFSSLKGSLSFNLDANKIEKASFKGKALLVSKSASVATPTGVNMSGIKNPIGVTDANADLILYGTMVNMSALTIDTGVVIEHLSYVGKESIELTDRKATLKTKVLTTDALFVTMMTNSELNTIGSAQFLLGHGAGNTITFNLPQLQMKTSPSVSWDKGLANLDLEFGAVPATKESDYSIVYS